MTIVAALENYIDETNSAVKLARYAQICGIRENAFFGVNCPTEPKDKCNPIYTLAERRTIARYLAEAQEEIEQVVGFPLAPRWFYDEAHPYAYPVHANWTKIIAVGFEATASISAGVTVDYTTDPAVVVVATSVTDEDEIAVYHPSTTYRIYPSAITIAGGTATIEIPIARLVQTIHQDNDEQGLDYTDVPPSPSSPFEATVDIARVYVDSSIQGAVVWAHRAASACSCDCAWCCATCSDYRENACIYIRNAETCALDLLPATYDASAGWTPNCLECYCEAPTSVLLNYKAGLVELTAQVEDAVVRLAHSKMPAPPCGCGVLHELWTRDRNIPAVLDAKRLDCPFGLSDGAWVAWRFANAMRNQRGMAL